jgi:hypothetical protein
VIEMESAYCAVRTESVTIRQVNVSIGGLTVVTWTEGNVRVCVFVRVLDIVYETQYCGCDLLLSRILHQILTIFMTLGILLTLKSK